MHDTTEEYLETILELEEEGVPPLRARLVERLGQAAPTVSETVSRLEDAGFLLVGEDRLIELTERGRTLGTKVVRRHRLAERLLVDVIGVDWSKAHHEACKWEHVISDEVEQKLVDLLGDPATCPHGSPIPGSSNAVHHQGVISVADAAPGRVEVIRIAEVLESDDDAMVLLDRAGFIPGEIAEVLGRRDADTDAGGEAAGDGAGVAVAGIRGDALLSAYVARQIFVIPA